MSSLQHLELEGHFSVLGSSVSLNQLHNAWEYFEKLLSPLLLASESSDIHEVRNLAKQHGTTVNRLLKLLISRLSPSLPTTELTYLGSASCTALQALSTLRLVLKGGRQELAVQRYAVFRKLLACQLYQLAWQEGWKLYADVYHPEQGDVQNGAPSDMQIAVVISLVIVASEVASQSAESTASILEVLPAVDKLLQQARFGSLTEQAKYSEAIVKHLHKCLAVVLKCQTKNEVTGITRLLLLLRAATKLSGQCLTVSQVLKKQVATDAEAAVSLLHYLLVLSQDPGGEAGDWQEELQDMLLLLAGSGLHEECCQVFTRLQQEQPHATLAVYHAAIAVQAAFPDTANKAIHEVIHCLADQYNAHHDMACKESQGLWVAMNFVRQHGTILRKQDGTRGMGLTETAIQLLASLTVALVSHDSAPCGCGKQVLQADMVWPGILAALHVIKLQSQPGAACSARDLQQACEHVSRLLDAYLACAPSSTVDDLQHVVHVLSRTGADMASNTSMALALPVLALAAHGATLRVKACASSGQQPAAEDIASAVKRYKAHVSNLAKQDMHESAVRAACQHITALHQACGCQVSAVSPVMKLLVKSRLQLLQPPSPTIPPAVPLPAAQAPQQQPSMARTAAKPKGRLAALKASKPQTAAKATAATADGDDLQHASKRLLPLVQANAQVPCLVQSLADSLQSNGLTDVKESLDLYAYEELTYVQSQAKDPVLAQAYSSEVLGVLDSHANSIGDKLHVQLLRCLMLPGTPNHLELAHLLAQYDCVPRQSSSSAAAMASDLAACCHALLASLQAPVAQDADSQQQGDSNLWGKFKQHAESTVDSWSHALASAEISAAGEETFLRHPHVSLQLATRVCQMAAACGDESLYQQTCSTLQKMVALLASKVSLPDTLQHAWLLLSSASSNSHSLFSPASLQPLLPDSVFQPPCLEAASILTSVQEVTSQCYPTTSLALHETAEAAARAAQAVAALKLSSRQAQALLQAHCHQVSAHLYFVAGDLVASHVQAQEALKITAALYSLVAANLRGQAGAQAGGGQISNSSGNHPSSTQNSSSSRTSQSTTDLHSDQADSAAIGQTSSESSIQDSRSSPSVHPDLIWPLAARHLVSLYWAARVFEASAASEDALYLLMEARKVSQQLCAVQEDVLLCCLMAQLQRRRGDGSTAARLLQQAKERHSTDTSSPASLYVSACLCQAEADLLHATGSHDSSITSYAQALNYLPQAEQLASGPCRDPFLLWHVHSLRLQLLRKQAACMDANGDTAAAIALLQKALHTSIPLPHVKSPGSSVAGGGHSNTTASIEPSGAHPASQKLSNASQTMQSNSQNVSSCCKSTFQSSVWPMLQSACIDGIGQFTGLVCRQLLECWPVDTGQLLRQHAELLMRTSQPPCLPICTAAAIPPVTTLSIGTPSMHASSSAMSSASDLDEASYSGPAARPAHATCTAARVVALQRSESQVDTLAKLVSQVSLDDTAPLAAKKKGGKARSAKPASSAAPTVSAQPAMSEDMCMSVPSLLLSLQLTQHIPCAVQHTSRLLADLAMAAGCPHAAAFFLQLSICPGVAVQQVLNQTTNQCPSAVQPLVDNTTDGCLSHTTDVPTAPASARSHSSQSAMQDTMHELYDTISSMLSSKPTHIQQLEAAARNWFQRSLALLSVGACICSVTCTSDGGLLLCRMSVGCTPLLVQLPPYPCPDAGPMDSARTQDPLDDSSIGIKPAGAGSIGAVLQQLSGILQDSANSMKDAVADTQARRVQWWKARLSLDTRMQQLVQQLQSACLSPWQVLLQPHILPLQTDDRHAAAASLLSQHFPAVTGPSAQSVLTQLMALCMEQAPVLSQSDVHSLLSTVCQVVQDSVLNSSNMGATAKPRMQARSGRDCSQASALLADIYAAAAAVQMQQLQLSKQVDANHQTSDVSAAAAQVPLGSNANSGTGTLLHDVPADTQLRQQPGLFPEVMRREALPSSSLLSMTYQQRQERPSAQAGTTFAPSKRTSRSTRLTAMSAEPATQEPSASETTGRAGRGKRTTTSVAASAAAKSRSPATEAAAAVAGSTNASSTGVNREDTNAASTAPAVKTTRAQRGKKAGTAAAVVEEAAAQAAGQQLPAVPPALDEGAAVQFCEMTLQDAHQPKLAATTLPASTCQPSVSPCITNSTDGLDRSMQNTTAQLAPANAQRGPLLLILDPQLHCVPWESMPCLREQQVYRLPSLTAACAFARSCQPAGQAAQGTAQHAAGQPLHDTCPLDKPDRIAPASQPTCCVDARDAYYVLNPDGDLADTQHCFEEWLSSQLGWKGIAGTPPHAGSLLAALQQHPLFVYMGHGSGEQYLPAAALRRLKNCAADLLMGCSSGRLRLQGKYGAAGAVLAYLMAGSPAVVANLWDVTDRDIDRFSTAILSTWLPKQQQNGKKSLSGVQTEGKPKQGKSKGKYLRAAKEEENQSGTFNPHQACSSPALGVDMAKAVGASRSACKLPFLIGAAPVCYGLPTDVMYSNS